MPYPEFTQSIIKTKFEENHFSHILMVLHTKHLV